MFFLSGTWTSVHLLAAKWMYQRILSQFSALQLFTSPIGWIPFSVSIQFIYSLIFGNLRYFDCLRMDKAAGKPDHDSDFVYTSASVWSHSSKSMHKETSDKKRQTNSMCVCIEIWYSNMWSGMRLMWNKYHCFSYAQVYSRCTLHFWFVWARACVCVFFM